MAEYVVKGAEPNETVLHTRTPNGYESWHWLPVREKVMRCRDCKSFREDATPHDHERPHFCGLHGIDLPDGDGFCKWGRPREAGTSDGELGSERPELTPKPCPFCGGRAKVEKTYLWNEPLYQVRCRGKQRDCPVSPATPFGYTTEERAILVWNRRADA